MVSRTLCHLSCGVLILYRVYIHYLEPLKLCLICAVTEASSRNQQRYCRILLGFATYQPDAQEITVIQPRKEHKEFTLMVSANMFVIRLWPALIPQSWLEGGRRTSLEPFPLSVGLALHALAATLLLICRRPLMVATMVPQQRPRPALAASGLLSHALMPPASTRDLGQSQKRALAVPQPEPILEATRCSSGIRGLEAGAGARMPDTVRLAWPISRVALRKDLDGNKTTPFPRANRVVNGSATCRLSKSGHRSPECAMLALAHQPLFAFGRQVALRIALERDVQFRLCDTLAATKSDTCVPQRSVRRCYKHRYCIRVGVSAEPAVVIDDLQLWLSPWVPLMLLKLVENRPWLCRHSRRGRDVARLRCLRRLSSPCPVTYFAALSDPFRCLRTAKYLKASAGDRFGQAPEACRFTIVLRPCLDLLT